MTRIGDTDATDTTVHETIRGIEVRWECEISELDLQTNNWSLMMKAVIPQSNKTELTVQTDSDYEQHPTQTEAKLQKRTIINLLVRAEVLPGPEIDRDSSVESDSDSGSGTDE